VYFFLEAVLPLRKLFGALIARGEAVQQANAAAQQALLGLTPDSDWQTVTSQVENWRDLFIALCDSPPEVMFLNEIIDSYQLKPQKGRLTSDIINLRLQVWFEASNSIDRKRYRVDFLINDRIVVEIDGKTYHSNSEAVKRDLERDSFLTRNGLIVVRIPAQAVFDSPQAAVKKVADRIAFHCSATIATDNKPTKFNLSGALSGVSKFVDDWADAADRRRVHTLLGTDALQQQRKAFDQETKAIERAIAIGSRWIEEGKYRSQSSDHATWFDAAQAPKRPAFPAKAIPAFEAPIMSGDPQRDSAMRRAFEYLVNDRSDYFSKVRMRMDSDKHLAALVKGKLCDEGRPVLWEAIAPQTL